MQTYRVDKFKLEQTPLKKAHRLDTDTDLNETAQEKS